ncbi:MULTISPECIES: sulfotransferase family protein [unclassified Pseudoalteromonas]|uniref:sulfotransferase family protein n=1 Tax=unclassified Pseudoalteromonas TaxID=194690 RepID=UPI000CF7332C|nr:MULTISPECIES: sulfotransferase family protein [unclassified Pseudoalteromonas]
MNAVEKIFVLGLPRTGTTSVCVAALQLGLPTAHTAYTQACFEQAQVVADTPCFSHFPELAKRYPHSRFILLCRDEQSWLASIKQLLARMSDNLLCTHGGFSPLLKQSYGRVFAPLNEQTLGDDEHLLHCYRRHQHQVREYFADQSERLLCLNLSEPGAYQTFCRFLQVPPQAGAFAHLNKGNKVMAWRDIKSPLKIASTRNGKVDNLDSWWLGERPSTVEMD